MSRYNGDREHPGKDDEDVAQEWWDSLTPWEQYVCNLENAIIREQVEKEMDWDKIPDLVEVED